MFGETQYVPPLIQASMMIQPEDAILNFAPALGFRGFLKSRY